MSLMNLKLQNSNISLPQQLIDNQNRTKTVLEAKSLFVEDYVKLKKYHRSLDTDENEIEDFEFTEKCLTDKERLLNLYKSLCDVLSLNTKSGFLNSIMSNDLNLSYLYINDFDLMPICQVLTKRITLEQLNLSSNFITSDGLKYVSSMLCHCTNLKELDLSSNKIEWLNYLVKYIDKATFNQGILVLNLSNNNINDDQAKDLGLYLRKNAQIFTLVLSGNKFGKKTCDMLADLITDNTHLEYLDVSSNLLDESSICLFAKALKKNNILTHLNLSYNRLSKEGTLLLAKAFIGTNRNQTLTYLDLTANDIGEQAAIALSRHLKQAKQLIHLKIGLNPLGCLGSYAILSAFTEPSAKLECLELKGIVVNNNFVKLLTWYNANHREIKVNYESVHNHVTLRLGEPYTNLDDFNFRLLDDASIRKCLSQDPFKFLLKYFREYHPDIFVELKKWDEKEEFKIYIEHFMDCLKQCTDLSKAALSIIYAHLKKAKDSAGQICILPFILPNTLTCDQVKKMERDEEKQKETRKKGTVK